MDLLPQPRRVRTGRPTPRIHRLVPTEADTLIFEAIERHGPLPSNYLYEFIRHIRRDRTHFQNRLTELFNGDDRGSYLVRPPQQFAAYQGRYQHLVYDLAPRARQVLAACRAAISSPPRSDPFVHRLMSACVGASFELAAAAHNLRYIPFRTVLERGHDIVARRAKNPLALPSPSAGEPAIIPDLVFGLEYPGAGFRFFAVECDRNTESIERRNLRQSAFARKLEGYGAALNSQTFRSWWGVPNLHVLTVTTSETHAVNIVSAIQRHVAPQHHHQFGVVAVQSFGADWRVPQAPLTCLLVSLWHTVSGEKSIALP